MSIRFSSRAHKASPGKLSAQLRAGFSIGELLIVITIMGILSAFTAKGVKSFSQQQLGERATRAILWEITVARSYALRAGSNMTLFFDEPNKMLIIRDPDGKVWRTTRFGPTEELRVKAFDVNTPGDSLTFSPRGICLNCSGGGATTVTVDAGSRRGVVSTSVLGRTELVSIGPN